jgi:hypothetical protein
MKKHLVVGFIFVFIGLLLFATSMPQVESVSSISGKAVYQQDILINKTAVCTSVVLSARTSNERTSA